MSSNRSGTTPAATDADQFDREAHAAQGDLAWAKLRDSLLAGATSPPTQAVDDAWFEALRDRVRRATGAD